MITNVKHGWANINIADKNNSICFCASYLTDVPMDFLNIIKNYYESYTTPAIEFECEERGEFLMVFTRFEINIKDNETWLPAIEYDIDKIFNEIIQDIENNIDEFCVWDYSLETKAELNSRKKDILNKIDEIKEIMVQREKERDEFLL